MQSNLCPAKHTPPPTPILPLVLIAFSVSEEISVISQNNSEFKPLKIKEFVEGTGLGLKRGKTAYFHNSLNISNFRFLYNMIEERKHRFR